MSTSREVMQALMPGDEEVESGEGAGRGYLRQLTACRAHDVYDRLGEITAPTRVIHEGVGHIPEVECDERFNSDLLAFLP